MFLLLRTGRDTVFAVLEIFDPITNVPTVDELSEPIITAWLGETVLLGPTMRISSGLTTGVALAPIIVELLPADAAGLIRS